MLIFTIINLTTKKNRDVLCLKNGSIIFGKLMEIIDTFRKYYNRLEIKFAFKF